MQVLFKARTKTCFLLPTKEGDGSVVFILDSDFQMCGTSVFVMCVFYGGSTRKKNSYIPLPDFFLQCLWSKHCSPQHSRISGQLICHSLHDKTRWQLDTQAQREGKRRKMCREYLLQLHHVHDFFLAGSFHQPRLFFLFSFRFWVNVTSGEHPCLSLNDLGTESHYPCGDKTQKTNLPPSEKDLLKISFNTYTGRSSCLGLVEFVEQSPSPWVNIILLPYKYPGLSEPLDFPGGRSRILSENKTKTRIFLLHQRMGTQASVLANCSFVVFALKNIDLRTRSLRSFGFIFKREAEWEVLTGRFSVQPSWEESKFQIVPQLCILFGCSVSGFCHNMLVTSVSILEFSLFGLQNRRRKWCSEADLKMCSALRLLRLGIMHLPWTWTEWKLGLRTLNKWVQLYIHVHPFPWTSKLWQWHHRVVDNLG